MFNRTTHVHAGPSTVVKHEHRAPTDESVRLLREMEAEAERRVTEAIRLEKNGFSAVVQIFSNARDASFTAKCVFDLNGKRLTVEETVSADDVFEDQDALFKKVLEAAAKTIAGELIIPAFVAQTRRPL